MRFPSSWLLRFLFLSGLTRAACGFEVSAATLQAQTQPLSLDIDFFVQINQHEFKVPIMPLHLLGKKSWNVYNTANIEKVRKDEALAAAKEAAEEERMQALDAERRMQILRGEIPTPLAIEDAPSSSSKPKAEREDRNFGREKKRRKKAGENDTDFEMRVAREQAEDRTDVDKQLVLRRESVVDAPLTDERGHISLFPQEGLKKGDVGREKNAEVEKEKERKKRELEDQYTMRFSNAAGFKQSLGETPWYEKGGRVREEEEDMAVVGKDVWGNEDPRRKQREQERIVSNDPLAMMKAGARKVREVERERKKWREEREREIRDIEEAEARERRRKRKRGIEDDEDEDDDLESFRLDEQRKSSSRRDYDGDDDRERRHRRKESRRSSHREEGRHRHRHRHRHHD